MNKQVILNEREIAAILNALKSTGNEAIQPLAEKLATYL